MYRGIRLKYVVNLPTNQCKCIMTHAGAISTKDAGGTNGTLNILLKFVTKFCLDLVFYLGSFKNWFERFRERKQIVSFDSTAFPES